MTVSFLVPSNSNQSLLLPTATPQSDSDEPQRESVQILVVGSRQGVNRVVYRLHQLGFAEVNEWSVLIPAPVPGKWMRSLIRHVLLE